MANPTKLRIMALHGYTSNQFMLSKRMGAIRKACKDVADFTFLNGPHLVQPITWTTQSLDAPDSESTKVDENTPLEEQPRAWWKASDDGDYIGWDETVSFINAQLKEKGPFDGVLGFSQGACMAALIASAFEDPSRLPGLELPAGQGPLRFCVAVSGFQARDPKLQSLFPKEGIQTPICHVLGRNDQIVDAERSQTLVDVAPNSRVDWHEGGHSVPSQAPWRHFFADFFSTFVGEPYTPSDAWRDVVPASERPKGEQSASLSAAGSGASTPAHNTNTQSRSGAATPAREESSRHSNSAEHAESQSQTDKKSSL